MPHADPFPTEPFEGVYLVTDELKLATHADVDVLERELGFRMPHGYRQYVTTLGGGDYCDILCVHLPHGILKGPRRLGQPSSFTHWQEVPAGWTRTELTEAVEFAWTSNADTYAVHPDRPEMILCFDNGGEPAQVVDARSTRLEDLYWRSFDRELRDPPGFRTFESWTPFDLYNLGPLPLTIAELAGVVDRSFAASERHRVDYHSGNRAAASFYVKAVGGYLIVRTDPSGFIDGVTLIDRSPDAATLQRWWAALVDCGLDRPKPRRVERT